MGVNDHTLFGHVRLIDRPLLVLNLLLLMGVVAIPFPTALIAEHLTGPNRSGGSAATVIYGIVMIVISLCYSAVWEYLVRHAEPLGSRSTRQRLRASIPGFGASAAMARIPRWSIGLVGYLLGTLIAGVWSAGGAPAGYGAAPVFCLVKPPPAPPRPAARAG